MIGRPPIVKRYVVDSETGCWNWLLSRNRGGYGNCWDGAHVGKAHRVAYAEHYGPIPEGMEIDHLCRNRACVNPDHLEAVTREENIRRSPIATLTAAEVRALREERTQLGTRFVDLAVKYGVSWHTVSEVVRRKTWRDI